MIPPVHIVHRLGVMDFNLDRYINISYCSYPNCPKRDGKQVFCGLLCPTI